MLIAFITTFLHELAHLIAARAQGVPCRLGIGNRLWIMVAETDMTGIWALPKSRRYLPILAGPLLDLVSVSSLILVLFGSSIGLLSLPSLALQIIQATTLIYLLRLIWQLFFFVRTDLYFVFTTFCGCKNLLEDTQGYLKNLVAAAFRKPPPVPQEHIPAREMTAIRTYTVFWLVGRGLAFTVLLLVTLPTALHYLASIYSTLVLTPGADVKQTIDLAIIMSISVLFGIAGFSLWTREIINSRRKQ